MNFRKYILFSVYIATCLILWGTCFGQEQAGMESVQFSHLSVENGLSQNTVLCIWQDKQGFLWIGTRDGLNKYDGYSFTVYKPDPADPTHTFSHNVITDICEDRAGRMWVTTLGGGLQLFDRRSGKATTYRVIDSDRISLRNVMFSVMEDHYGILWIASRKGLISFNTTSRNFTLHKPFNSANPDVFAVEEDKLGQLWVGTKAGLFLFDRGSGSATLIPLPATEPAPAIASILSDDKGTLWIATESGHLYQIEPGGRPVRCAIREPDRQENRMQIMAGALLKTRSGDLWAAPPGLDRLIRLNPKTNHWNQFGANLTEQGSLSSNTIFSLFQDQEGLIWVGTNNGLDILNPVPEKFHSFQVVPNITHVRLPQNSIRALCQDRSGLIWLSNESSGLYSFQPATGKYQAYPANPSDPNQLISNNVNAIWEDRSGHLWVGAGACLHQFEPKTGRFIRYPSSIAIRSIREGLRGELWLAGNGGLASFDTKTHQFTYYRHDPRNPATLGDEGLILAVPTRDGSVWTASVRRGISRLNIATGRFKQYQPDYQSPSGKLNDKDIRCIYEDRKGRVWIGTNQGGLNVYQPQTDSFTAFTTHHGLPSNHVTGILEDEEGNLWLATNQGVSRLNPQTRQCQNYDKNDGLQANEFLEAYAHGLTNTLLFGGANGFSMFAPRRIQINKRIPPVYITNVQIGARHAPLPQKKIVLSHLDNYLSFDFLALNFIHPEKNTYAYQLVGVDKNWIFSGTRRFVSYANLPPGDYQFNVKAANNDGIWNQKGTSLEITIQPPFWNTTWFIFLVVSVLLGLLYLGFRYRVRQIQQEEWNKTEVNKKLAEMEMQALRAQMNPHFIFNSLNSINRFIMKNESESASVYLSKFSKLIRLILNRSTASLVTLASELDTLSLYLELESLRFSGQFTYSIQVDEAVEPEFTELPPMLIQPYVENAIWHGLMQKEGGGHILIEIQKQGKQLSCVIEDNGVGREKAAALKSKSATHTKSKGMQITADRLKLSQTLYGQQPTVSIHDLVDDQGEPAGTRVVLTIPLV
ncbi:sensor histidine kinase [Spirosoma flavus]